MENQSRKISGISVPTLDDHQMDRTSYIEMQIAIFNAVRKKSVEICAPLEPEDYVLQPMVDVSPPKWHLAHSTWFFENFILKNHLNNYKEFHPVYGFLFNSYYESIGKRTFRQERGHLSRPTVNEVLAYRNYVDENMRQLISEKGDNPEVISLLELGLQHEQQHQELLYTDIKFSLSLNPLDIKIADISEYVSSDNSKSWIEMPEGIYDIGFEGKGFCFDNELGRHSVFLNSYKISTGLITNNEWLQFINSRGYSNSLLWHSEGWSWLNENHIESPMFWEKNSAGNWVYYTLDGRKEVNLSAPVSHISYFEAAAFAEWAGKRLPTEAEWESASEKFSWGQRWEWTNSAYLPYPGYKKAEGAIGEYNGKFMINQMVLRGASVATPENHSRKTYRNFFSASARWQFSGLRLAG